MTTLAWCPFRSEMQWCDSMLAALTQNNMIMLILTVKFISDMACKRPKEPQKDIWDVEGGYMGVKKQKLIAQFKEQAGKEESSGNIFSGVAIFVNGLTHVSGDELKRIMMTYGGVYHHYQNQQTTHIIASNLPDVKVRTLKGNEKIVRPEWITESVKAGKLLDYKNYILYTNLNKQQLKMDFKPKSPMKTSNPQATSNRSTNDAKDPNFLEEYFTNSRLHHISLMGSEAKDYISELRNNHTGEFPARINLQQLSKPTENFLPEMETVIAHIDMDCFFVSVGLRGRPDLRGHPVAVTHTKGNNPDDKTTSMAEIASCSYEAREKGVKNGMFMGQALRLCPDLETIPYDFEGYKSASRKLYDIVASYTMNIMAVSCDEMFVDISSLCRDVHMRPEDFALKLREEVLYATGCPSSVGIGPNILLARLATKKAKPNGQFMVTQHMVEDFMAVFSVRDLPGIGRNMEEKLRGLDVVTVGDLLSVQLSKLKDEFGQKSGQMLYDKARGIDDRQLEYDHVRKSIGIEVNYGIRFTTWDEVQLFLERLSEELSSRMKRLSLEGRSVTLKLMVRAENADVETSKYNGHGICDTSNKTSSLHSHTNSKELLFKEIFALTKSSLTKEVCDLRGVGVSMTKLRKIGANTSDNKNQSILKYVNSSFEPGETIKNNENHVNAIVSEDSLDANTHNPGQESFENEDTFEDFTLFDTIGLNQKRKVADEMPTFCGKSSVEDVKILLKEWVLESNNPDDEDMEMILEFLLKLIKCWRLDLLENYLKCLRRTITKSRMVLHLFSFFDFPLIGLMTLGGVTCDLSP